MKQPIIIEFDKCPNCGSKERLVGGLAEKEKKKGNMRKDLNFYAYIIPGVVKDPQREHQLLIGTSLPAYKICLDVCLQCGTIYTAKIEIGEATKQLRQPLEPKKPPTDLPFLKG